MSILMVSGTGTGVGKTMTTAAIAALAVERGERVAILKPVQTGVAPDATGDLATVQQLAGPVTTLELCRYPDPLSPEAAARISNAPTVNSQDIADAARQLHQNHDIVLIEGAGGLLVRFNPKGHTLADTAQELGVATVIVAQAGLGTLNTTALTAEVAARRGLYISGVIIGQWPADPDLATRCNLTDLPVVAEAPLLGALSDGLDGMSPTDCLAAAKSGLSPMFGGVFDWQAFVKHFPCRGGQ